MNFALFFDDFEIFFVGLVAIHAFKSLINFCNQKSGAIDLAFCLKLQFLFLVNRHFKENFALDFVIELEGDFRLITFVRDNLRVLKIIFWPALPAFLHSLYKIYD